MRSDESLNEKEFQKSEDWKFDALDQRAKPEIDRRFDQGGIESDAKHLRHSFSGHERNCWFHNDGAGGFIDMSGLSGVDNIADGRAHAVWDFDRDGFSDIALVNANEPFLNLYHNRMATKAGKAANMLAIRLVGGNDTPQPMPGFSNRDGYGAVVTIDLVPSGRRIKREHRCGAGFAAQNSNALLVGIGDARGANVNVKWSSGKESLVENVDPGTEVTIYEDPSHAPNDNGYSLQSYFERRVNLARRDARHGANEGDRRSLRGFDEQLRSAPKHVFTSMATWCDACKRELAQVAALRDVFPATEVGLWAVPVDPIDTSQSLADYAKKFQPQYTLLTELTARQTEDFQRVLRRSNPTLPLPMSVIVDSDGQVLSVLNGVPTVSEVGLAE